MRTTSAFLLAFVLVDVSETVLAIGHYEHRITVVSHGNPDVAPAALAYEIFALLVEDVLGLTGLVGTVRALVWSVALVLALAALYRIRDRIRPVAGWLVAAAVIKVVAVTCTLMGPALEGVLSTRPIVYPLWLLGSAAVVVAVRQALRSPPLVSRPA